jgi:hypothetical protein
MGMLDRTPALSEVVGESPIPSICKPLRSVVMALVSRSGALKDANRGFVELLPASTPAAQLLDIRYLFVHPRFDQIAARRADRAGGVIIDGVMNIGDFRTRVASLNVTIFESGDDLFLVGEHDIGLLQELNTELLNLNEQLAEKQRELARVSRQLRHHRTQSEGALQDRDALLNLLSVDESGKIKRRI